MKQFALNMLGFVPALVAVALCIAAQYLFHTHSLMVRLAVTVPLATIAVFAGQALVDRVYAKVSSQLK